MCVVNVTGWMSLWCSGQDFGLIVLRLIIIMTCDSYYVWVLCVGVCLYNNYR